MSQKPVEITREEIYLVHFENLLIGASVALRGIAGALRRLMAGMPPGQDVPVLRYYANTMLSLFEELYRWGLISAKTYLKSKALYTLISNDLFYEWRNPLLRQHMINLATELTFALTEKYGITPTSI